MTATAEKKIDPKKLDFCNLDELPREAGVTLADLGIGENEYLILCRRMKGDAEARGRLEVVREVLFELMKRDMEDRLIKDDFGKLPTVDEVNSLGQKIKVAVKETEPRSRWGVKEGADTYIGGAGDGREKPKSGHWKTYVKDHWEHLAPTLKFRRAGVTPPRQDPMANPEQYKANVEYSLSDENPDRQALLSWLPKFLEDGKPSSWDGRK